MPVLASLTLLAVLSANKSKGPAPKDIELLNDATEVVQTLTETPDSSIPEDLLKKSECILVFPKMKKGAFIVGGTGGKGVASCRGKDDRMGAPAVFGIGGASIGFQVGGQSSDVVLLVMNPAGMDRLLRDRCKIGADATAAAGPVGRTTQASTDIAMHAQILTWSRARGLFAGVSLDGTTIQPADEANARLYGKGATAREIIIKQEHATPEIAKAFVETIRKHTARATKKP